MDNKSCIARDNRGISPIVQVSNLGKSRFIKRTEKDITDFWEGPIDSYTFLRKVCMATFGGIAYIKLMHAHMYDMILKGGIAI